MQTATADPGKDAAVLVAKIHSVKFQHLVGPTSIESKWLTRMKGATFTLDVEPQSRPDLEDGELRRLPAQPAVR